MPLYEYRCDACGHSFEQIQKFSDPPVEVCPSCGEPQVRKLLSSPAIQFKGSGWYITDYARKGAKDSDGGTKPAAEAKDTTDKKSTPADSGGASASSGTTDSAPAAKS